MKNILVLITAVAITLLFNSCGINNAIVENSNQNSTQVHLAGNNFKVTERVTGSAEVKYTFLFGGMNQRQLYENAYADMLRKANLSGSSKAVINVVTENHFRGFFPFFFVRQITISAYVIEFTK